MDPWTLAYLAGHRDMNITKRYVHPQEQTVRAAMERAQVANGGHSSGHTDPKVANEKLPHASSKELGNKGLEWYARADSNGRPFAPEANALSS